MKTGTGTHDPDKDRAMIQDATIRFPGKLSFGKSLSKIIGDITPIEHFRGYRPDYTNYVRNNNKERPRIRRTRTRKVNRFVTPRGQRTVIPQRPHGVEVGTSANDGNVGNSVGPNSKEPRMATRRRTIRRVVKRRKKERTVQAFETRPPKFIRAKVEAMNVAEIKELMEKNNVSIPETGSGANGAVVKGDLVNAIVGD
jgi:hypothetical protein